MADKYMRFPGGKLKALTLSYDDGVQSDERLIRIMKENGLKGTFNINSGAYAPEGKVFPEGTIHRRMSKSEAIALYSESGMEVAVHGLTHPHLELLPAAACCYEVIADRKNLEDDFGIIIRGMAYPYGTYNDDVIACLQQCGIAYSRTTVATHKFELPAQWLAWHSTCHHKDPDLEALMEKFLIRKTQTPLLFYLWGHSYEFDQDNDWEIIENFAKKVGHKDDIWYATNIEIYDYVQAYHQLQTSTDGRLLHNPTALTLYYAVLAGKLGWVTRSIGPGETKER